MRLAFAIFLLFSLTLSGGTLTWHSDYNEAFNIAKKEHKLFMLFLTQPGCKTCVYMRDKTLQDTKVKTYLQTHFIVAELYMQARSLPRRYRAQMSPVFTFIDPEEDDIVEQIMGGRTPKRFLQTLHGVVEDEN